jgi:hypothetical protein
MRIPKLKIPRPRIPFRKKKVKITGNSGKCEICGTSEYGLICLLDHKKKMREMMKEFETIASLEDEKAGLKRWNDLKRSIG